MDSTQMQLMLTELGLSQAALGRAVGISKSAVSRLVLQGEWPGRNAAATKRAMAALLIQRGATAQHLAVMTACGMHSATNLEAQASNPQEDLMLLANETVSPETRKHFGLARSPFIDDISSRADVWASTSTRFVRAALMDAAQYHGFLALIGESGSGKSTLREELEERIAQGRQPVIVIKPYTLDMEPTEAKGKVMKSGAIAEAIGRALAPSLGLKSSPESRFAQVHGLLRDSCRAGNRHLLVIEEAHRMPLATLKHLKGWMELKDGLRRLLGVCLNGQPELDGLLSEQRPEIREIVQRCEKVHMEPLDADLEGYLKHKFDRVGARAADVFADDAYDALRARLIYTPRGGRPADAKSICYPQALNNRAARAMNAAAKAGWPKVDANVVAAC